MKIIKKPSSKKTVLIIAAIILVCAAAAGAYFYYKNSQPAKEESKVNYNPPTNDERNVSVEQDKKNKEREELDKNPPVVSTANVAIVDANQYDDAVEVRGYIDNVYEDGGTCTATFKKGDLSVTKSNPAFKDAKTIQCGALDFKRAQFAAAGSWEMTLTYKSPTVEGSAVKTVEIK
ncbi:MAG TPA: hypothetical protein VK502_00775 [Candidatus Saccharimonadales bacterium]|nr:hypothetical protein [Candidatus Saccharimonadales bacterium]